jgi:hypothetical protein
MKVGFGVLGLAAQRGLQIVSEYGLKKGRRS